MIKLRILRWEDYPGLSRWALNVIMSVLLREAEGEVITETEEKGMQWWSREKSEDVMLLALKMDKGAMSHRMQAGICRRNPTKSCKRQGNGFSPRASGVCTAFWHLGFGPVKLIADFWPSEVEESECILFWANRLVVICYRGHTKLIQILLPGSRVLL